MILVLGTLLVRIPLPLSFVPFAGTKPGSAPNFRVARDSLIEGTGPGESQLSHPWPKEGMNRALSRLVIAAFGKPDIFQRKADMVTRCARQLPANLGTRLSARNRRPDLASHYSELA
jgi:hypothetical protein